MVEDPFVLHSIAPIDVELGDAVFLDDHVVETETADSRTATKPMVGAWFPVGVSRLPCTTYGNQALPEFQVHIVAFAPFLPADLLLFTKLHLILIGLGQRDDLLHIDQSFFAILVWPKTDAANVDIPLAQPKHRSGEFFAEVLGNQNDAHIWSEVLLVGLSTVRLVILVMA